MSGLALTEARMVRLLPPPPPARSMTWAPETMTYQQIVNLIDRASNDHRGLRGEALTRDEVAKLALLLEIGDCAGTAADLAAADAEDVSLDGCHLLTAEASI